MNREEKMEKLKDLLTEQISGIEYQYTESSDSSPAEYCTWGFAEGDGLRFDDLDDDIRGACEKVVEKLGKKDGDMAIANLASVESVHGLQCKDNELFSMTIGEVESELDEMAVDLIEELNLNDDDLNGMGLDAYFKGGMIYCDFNYERWALILDATADEVIELIKD